MEKKDARKTCKLLGNNEATLTFLARTRAGHYAKIEESSLSNVRLTAVTEDDAQEDAHCFGYR